MRVGTRKTTPPPKKKTTVIYCANYVTQQQTNSHGWFAQVTHMYLAIEYVILSFIHSFQTVGWHGTLYKLQLTLCHATIHNRTHACGSSLSVFEV